MGAKVVDAFVKNEAVTKYLDNRRKELGYIEPKELEEGVTHYGNLEGVDFYVTTNLFAMIKQENQNH
ncbi:Phage major capsid protein E [Escherichia coli]|nr:major capsid protein [Escherichia coli]STL59021.1 Phage major capsid protein E [Escherichia coli]